MYLGIRRPGGAGSLARRSRPRLARRVSTSVLEAAVARKARLEVSAASRCDVRKRLSRKKGSRAQPQLWGLAQRGRGGLPQEVRGPRFVSRLSAGGVLCTVLFGGLVARCPFVFPCFGGFVLVSPRGPSRGLLFWGSPPRFFVFLPAALSGPWGSLFLCLYAEYL